MSNSCCGGAVWGDLKKTVDLTGEKRYYVHMLIMRLGRIHCFWQERLAENSRVAMNLTKIMENPYENSFPLKQPGRTECRQV